MLNKDLVLTDNEFKIIRDMMYDYSGVLLKPTKKTMIISRLSKRIRELKLFSIKEYINLMMKNIREKEIFINLITTNETYFFREKVHLDFLIDTIKKENRKTIKIWSAACSTGEEPYSISIYLKQNLPFVRPTILATDINTDVLNQAKKAEYNSFRLRAVPEEWKKKYFKLIKERDKIKWYKLTTSLIHRVQFKQHNLLTPIGQTFDFIFLRNVMIYFDNEIKQRVIKNMEASLNKGGYLIIGRSENIFSLKHNLKHVASSTYKKGE